MSQKTSLQSTCKKLNNVKVDSQLPTLFSWNRTDTHSQSGFSTMIWLWFYVLREIDFEHRCNNLLTMILKQMRIAAYNFWGVLALPELTSTVCISSAMNFNDQTVALQTNEKAWLSFKCWWKVEIEHLVFTNNNIIQHQICTYHSMQWFAWQQAVTLQLYSNLCADKQATCI